MTLLEVCCGSVESVRAAVEGGARRIELCSALEVDGLTPSREDLRTVRALYPDLTVHVLIRPRAGDFCYTEEEVDRMAEAVDEALDEGADGIVTGCLTPKGDVDLAAMRRLVRPGVPVTFHRAFDACPRPFRALKEAIGLGCSRILTSGQAPTALEGADLIRALRKRARGAILLLPGGGVTPENAARILLATGCAEIHASASEIIDGKKVTSAAKVAAILSAIELI